MRNIVVICLIWLNITACTKATNIQVRKVEKPKYTFSLDNVQPVRIITNDRCYLLNAPKAPVVCMTEEDFKSNLDNYRIFLELAKQHKSSMLFFNSI